VPLILLLSVVPDADILLHFVEHRGPIHSAIVTLAICVPILAVYRKQAVPYFLAVVQHSLIGDYISGMPLRLLWPLTTQHYGMGLSIDSLTNLAIEWIVFAASLAMMLATHDIVGFLRPHLRNLVLSVPAFTVLMPILLGYPLSVPLLLVVPHVFYLALFSYALANAVRQAASYFRSFL